MPTPERQDDGGLSPKVSGESIELSGIEHIFGTKRQSAVAALGPLDLTIREGEFTALVGPSGTGKTTLLRIIGGLISPTVGSVTRRGTLLDGPPSDLGIVFQRSVLLEWRTVYRNIELQLELRKVGTKRSRRELADALLRRVGMDGLGDRYPWELSGGQQQRVALCRSLIHEPGLLLMDEPFGALDALTREQLQIDLERVWMERRPSLIFVTHDVFEAVTLADRVIVVTGRPGTITADFSVDVGRPRGGEIIDNPRLQTIAKEVRMALGRDVPKTEDRDAPRT